MYSLVEKLPMPRFLLMQDLIMIEGLTPLNDGPTVLDRLLEELINLLWPLYSDTALADCSR